MRASALPATRMCAGRQGVAYDAYVRLACLPACALCSRTCPTARKGTHAGISPGSPPFRALRAGASNAAGASVLTAPRALASAGAESTGRRASGPARHRPSGPGLPDVAGGSGTGLGSHESGEVTGTGSLNDVSSIKSG